MRVKKQRIIFGYILLELVLLNVSTALCFLFYVLINEGVSLDTAFGSQQISLLMIFNVSWVLTILIHGSQDLYVTHRIRYRAKELLVSACVFLGITLSLHLILGLAEVSSFLVLGVVGLFTCLNLAVFIYVKRFIFSDKSRARFGAKLLVLGAGENGKEVLHFTQHNKHLGYDVVGFLDDQYASNNGINLLGRIQDLPMVLDTKPVDEIVITLPAKEEDKIREAIQTADYRGIRVNVVPEYLPFGHQQYQAYNMDKLPVLQLRQNPLDQFHNFLLKKSFDLLFSLFVLIVFSPVFMLIGLLIYLESGGPIFYKPLRKGQANGVFRCYKFRTMRDSDDPVHGSRSTVKNDPRITRMGRFLRKYDLDELPQFINVLKGDMSVIGPRPHRLHLKDDFRQIVRDYMVRHYVKPGLSGWAQVNGWRGPTETDEQKIQRVKHDLWYIENWNFWLDFKIVFLTVFSRKTRQNAF